jgi:long-chain acyl-CoA synthetase
MALPRVERFVTSSGARLYRLPVLAFPELLAHVHLILTDHLVTLVDVGSGYGRSNGDLLAGFAVVRDEFSEKVTLADVKQILITHAHIDHFGGLTFVRQHCAAPVGVHELDRRVLDNYEERLIVASRSLRRFLVEAGVSDKILPEIMSMYTVTKNLFRSVEVGFTFEAHGMAEGPFRFTHVPGHCPGQVVIQIDDVLLTADHVLSHTTPHQAPETITRHTGLAHYLDSLRRVRDLPGLRLALGGHEAPITDLPARITAIEQMHRERLEKILDVLREPKTISRVSHELFGAVKGYHVLLAIEEAGAHVEYLAQRGELEIANLDEIAHTGDVPVLYQRVGGPGKARRAGESARATQRQAEGQAAPETRPNADRPWLKSYDFWVPESIRYPRLPVWRLLDLAARNWGDHPATIFLDETLSWREIKRQSERLAAGLVELGVKKGDRVGLMLPNCPQFVIAYYGLLRTGATLVNLNPTFTEREIAHIANDAGLTAVVALDALAPLLLTVRPRTSIAHIIFTGVQDYLPEALRAGYIQQQTSFGQLPQLPDDPALTSFSGLVAQSARPPEVDVDPAGDVAVLQYTGGTTGTPKGAMLTHFNLVANALQSYHWAREYVHKGAERYLVIIPLFHAYGMTMMNIAASIGAALILLPRFDPQMALQALRTHRPTFFPGVPTLYIALLNHPDARREDFNSLRSCNSGSAPLPLEVYARFREMTDATILEGYGLTEASPVTHSTPQLGPHKPGSIGIPFPDTEARITSLDDGTTPLRPGEVGELVIRGPQVMQGYWHRAEDTAQALRDPGDGGGPWLHTGDIARMDADGYFYIVDRKKDMLIVSGNNVYPREVEEVLYAHPAILEAGVIGVPDPYQGEAVKAFVVLKPGARATPDEIREHCRKELAPYKVPHTIELRDALPKSQVGKVLRRLLHEPAALTPAPAPAAISVPEDVSVSEYFENLLPRLFAHTVKPDLPSDLAGTEFTLQYTIRLPDAEAVYGVRVNDGQSVDVIPGGLAHPNLSVVLTETDWRDTVTGNVTLGRTPFDLLHSRARLDRAHAIKGTLNLELTRPDGSLYRTTMRYNESQDPSVTLMMTVANYAAMQRGELSGQAAFLNGSLKFEGDLGFLMALGALVS